MNCHFRYIKRDSEVATCRAAIDSLRYSRTERQLIFFYEGKSSIRYEKEKQDDESSGNTVVVRSGCS